MSWLSNLGDYFRRPTRGNVFTGRRTEAAIGMSGMLSPYQSRTHNVLKELRRIPEESAALEFLRKHHPDVSMAVWNFIRLANQGHEMHFEGVRGRAKGRRLPEVEERWREFASRVNALSNAGLDGLIDLLHYSSFLLGAQGVEVEVAPSRTEIVDVHVIKPQSVHWELEGRGPDKRWVPYQWQEGKKVSLEEANFLWVPTDPSIDDPRGNLIMSSALHSVDFQLQVLQDLQKVIHNQGWPRYDVKILREALLASIPPSVKADPAKAKKWVQERVNEIKNAFRDLRPDDSFVHLDDVEITMPTSGTATRSMDIRALGEMLDQQVMGGAKQLSVFMNRNSGVTETWGTVQFRIFASGIASVQRGSKRLIESMAAIWLRVNGIQAVPRFSHNVLDWNSEEQRWTVNLMKEEFYAIAQLMGWIDGDDAAQQLDLGDVAKGEPGENVRASLQAGGGGGHVSMEHRGGDHASRQGGRQGSEQRFRIIRPDEKGGW